MLNLFYKIFPYSSNFWPSWYLLAFKILGLHLPALLWVKGASKYSSGYYKSTFRAKNNPTCKKAAPAISMAFLTLMTLKLENNEIWMKLTPNDQIEMSNLLNLDFPSVWPLIWPFRPSLAFYNSFWNPWHLWSLLIGKNLKSQ